MHADLIADLHFDHLQFRICNNRVFTSCFHSQYVSNLHSLFHIIDHRTTFSGDYRPYFVPEIMAVVVHPVSRIQCYFDRHAMITHIQYPEASPGFFSEHYLLVELIHIRFDVAGLLLIRYQDSLGAGCHDDIF